MVSIGGEPLDKAQIRLEPLDGRSTPIAVITSDSKGRFAMVDLDAGRYRIWGERNGYLEPAYGARRARGEGTILQLEAGQSLGELTLRLTPAAVVAGVSTR